MTQTGRDRARPGRRVACATRARPTQRLEDHASPRRRLAAIPRRAQPLTRLNRATSANEPLSSPVWANLRSASSRNRARTWSGLSSPRRTRLLPGRMTNAWTRGSGSDNVSPGANALTGGGSTGVGAAVGGVVPAGDGTVVVVVLPEPVAPGVVVGDTCDCVVDPPDRYGRWSSFGQATYLVVSSSWAVVVGRLWRERRSRGGRVVGGRVVGGRRQRRSWSPAGRGRRRVVVVWSMSWSSATSSWRRRSRRPRRGRRRCRGRRGRCLVIVVRRRRRVVVKSGVVGGSVVPSGVVGGSVGFGVVGGRRRCWSWWAGIPSHITHA